MLELHEKLKQNAEELERQREKAVELTNVKSDFLASMSHELRTPLNSILGLTELVVKDLLSTAKTKERLNIVLRNGHKLLTLINNILEFSKIESGKVELKKDEFSLKEFAGDIFSFIEPLVMEKNLNFSLMYEFKNDKLLESDKSKIEQIIINLLGNAVKFTEHGKIRIKFTSFGNSLEIEVADTGIGIDENNMNEIFHEFKQLDSSTSRNYGGTGLGLAICKKYVSSLKGELKVSSKPGEGSIFTILIPGIIKEELIDVKVENLKTITQFEDITDSPFVLLVNNNQQVQKLIGDYLRTNNYNVKIFNGGGSALDFIKNETPSAVIIDINITDITPWEFVLQSVKILTPGIPVLITSIDEKRKVGYGFSVYKYIQEKEEIDLENIFPASTKFNSILFVSKKRGVKKSDASQTVDFIDDSPGPDEIIGFKEYDLIVINISQNRSNGINLYFELKKINQQEEFR